MCVLLILRDRVEGWPWVIAANRDEALARTARPPALVRGPFRFFAGSDPSGGGTWLGVNDRGLVTVITNRPGGVKDPTRPSRGMVTTGSLLQPDAAAARLYLEGLWKERCPWRIAPSEGEDDLHVEEAPLRGEPPPPYNPFNLFVARGDAGFVAYMGKGGNRGDGGQGESGRMTGGEPEDAGRTHRIVDVPPGVHVLTNDHELDALPAGDLVARIGPDRVWRKEERPDLVAVLKETLAWHEGVGPDGYRICKHGEEYGTVSSTIVAVGPGFPGDVLYLHAEGPPCEAPYEDLSATVAVQLG